MRCTPRRRPATDTAQRCVQTPHRPRRGTIPKAARPTSLLNPSYSSPLRGHESAKGDKRVPFAPPELLHLTDRRGRDTVLQSIIVPVKPGSYVRCHEFLPRELKM